MFLYSVGGDDGIRTHDPLLAGQVLSQLSYTPINMVGSYSPFFTSSLFTVTSYLFSYAKVNS